MKKYFAQKIAVAFSLLFSSIVAHAQFDSLSGKKLLVVAPGEGIKGYPGEWKIMGDQSGDAYSLVEISLAEPQKDWLPTHVHKREDEAWYVIEGELSFKVGDQTATAGPGTYVFAPRYIPHTYKVIKAPARYLLILSPSGAEYLFSEVEELRKKFRDSTGHFFPTPAYFEALKNISTTYHARGPVGNQKPFSNDFPKSIDTLAHSTTTAAITGVQALMDADAISKANENYRTPGPMHKVLAALNGEWKGDATFWPAPGAPPVKSTSSVVNKMLYGGLFQEGDHKGTIMGKPYETKLIWGYDNQKKKFFIVGVDNMGSGTGRLEGDYDTASKVFTMELKKPDPVTGELNVSREVRKIVNTNRQEMKMYTIDKKTGKEYQSLEIIYTRKK